MNTEAAYAVVRLAALCVFCLAAVNLLVVVLAPPSFDSFLRFGMTMPASIATGMNALSIFIIAAVRARDK